MSKYHPSKPRPSMEYFDPSPTSSKRTATAKSAVLNLVSTIIGGGVLSLPYAFEKCGLVLAAVMMFVIMLTSDFTLYILVSCSRRSGAHSYEAVVLKAVGKQWAQLITMLLLLALTFLAFTAYLVLIRDMASSLAQQFFFLGPVNDPMKNTITGAFVLCVSPVLFFRSINALRFTSVLSLISILVLAVAIGVRAISFVQSADFQPSHVKLFPTDWKDAVYAFPIISVSYLCHFNVLPVHGELRKPTRQRLKCITHATMFSTWMFYMVIGTMGYLFAFQQPQGVQDDILNNFSSADHLINLGRVGLLITVVLSLPLLLLPCRSTLYRFISICYQQLVVRSHTAEEYKYLLYTQDEDEVAPASTFTHILLTIFLVVCAFVLACTVPGVAVIWSIMGSTVGIIVAYVLPTFSYCQIRYSKPHTSPRKLLAWWICGLMSIAAIVCSCQTIVQLSSA